MATKTRSALDDRRTLERFALRFRTNGDDDAADELEEIAERIENPAVEVVEQTILGRKSPAAPDGWSWDDIGPFTGYWSGIRLQRGEPILEQDGHVLLLRQGETSFSPRQVPIYEGASAALRRGEDGEIHDEAVTVLVVHGYKGDRRGYTVFAGGRQLPTVVASGSEAILGFVLGWLKRSHENPIMARKLPERLPRQERLA